MNTWPDEFWAILGALGTSGIYSAKGKYWRRLYSNGTLFCLCLELLLYLVRRLIFSCLGRRKAGSKPSQLAR